MRKLQIDRKTVAVGMSILFLLSLALCILPRDAGRYAAALMTLLGALAAHWLLKKRRMSSVHRRTVMLIVAIFAVFYMTVLLLTGFHFGFYLSVVSFGFSSIIKYILPFVITIISTEIIRGALLGQKGRLPWLFAFAIGLVSEVLMQTTLAHVTSFNRFMDLAGITLLPAAMGQMLYQYLSANYSSRPTIVYRLIVTLFAYVIPIRSGMPDALVALASLLAPALLLFFIRLLYGKREKTARSKRIGRWFYSAVVAVLLFVISFVMLVSCQFRYGLLIIATESMTGELNKGDVALYEQYTAQTVKENEIVVFKKDDRVTVHRVVDIVHIDGENRYYTKGDANDDADYGYITDESIIGVVEGKLPYFGYPTLWLRELFKR